MRCRASLGSPLRWSRIGSSFNQLNACLISSERPLITKSCQGNVNRRRAVHHVGSSRRAIQQHPTGYKEWNSESLHNLTDLLRLKLQTVAVSHMIAFGLLDLDRMGCSLEQFCLHSLEPSFLTDISRRTDIKADHNVNEVHSGNIASSDWSADCRVKGTWESAVQGYFGRNLAEEKR